MNKEELIGKLQMVYVGDKNALNELIGYYDGLKQGIDELQQENQKYKEVIDKAIDLVEKLIKEYKLNYGDEPSKMLLVYETLLNTLREVE